MTGSQLVEGAPDKETIENRKKFFSKLKIELADMAWAQVAQGLKIARVNAAQAGKIIKAADGLMTDVKGLALAVTAADCLPIYFYDPVKQVIGLAHAGWRGLAKNFPARLIKKLAGKYKSDIKQIKVFVGPHIKSCHFEVRPDVAAKFRDYPKHLRKRPSKIFIDLAGVVKEQLVIAGLKPENFKVFGGCTYDNKNYFSFRRDQGKTVKAMAAFIVLC
ncbi:MAG: peptidoglycan editing factor PgeF [Parcubacteria group bacterium]|nr:peptidoglycan editing factor PgeF [Parcubacteria group bacterium]